VLGVSEVRWKGQGELRSGDYAVYYSGGETPERVAIVVQRSIVQSVVKKSVCSDRIIAVNLKAEPVSILIVQVYLPTSEYEDDEGEELYDIIEEILEEDGKGETNTIIMGDWNSVVGDKAHQNIIGPYDWEGEIGEVKC
jgi:exonuclease III